ncbi:MAG: tetratricopeptide repeat protein [Bryobacteraceae bacterium]|nr:tetratricopeptide repeat protein [Bryobacteraceae bacterium]
MTPKGNKPAAPHSTKGINPERVQARQTMIRIVMIGAAMLALGGGIAGIGWYLSQNKQEAKQSFEEAKKLMRPGSYAAAIAALDRTISEDASNKEALLLRGEAKLEINDYEGAVKDFTAAIALDDRVASAYTRRGAAYRKLNRDPEALSDFEKAIELQPSTELYAERALLYESTGDNQKALADWNTVVDMNPQWPAPYRGRARAKKALGDEAGSAEDAAVAKRLERGGRHFDTAKAPVEPTSSK